MYPVARVHQAYLVFSPNHALEYTAVRRFAFSVIWEMTPAGEIVDVDFCKSIIHSVAGLTYNQAQLMLDDPNIKDVKAESVRRLNELAKIFRKRRIDSGALTLASPEVRFQGSRLYNRPFVPILSRSCFGTFS